MKAWIFGALLGVASLTVQTCNDASPDQRMVGPVFGYQEPEDPVFGEYVIYVYKPHRVIIVWPDGGSNVE